MTWRGSVLGWRVSDVLAEAAARPPRGRTPDAPVALARLFSGLPERVELKRVGLVQAIEATAAFLSGTDTWGVCP